MQKVFDRLLADGFVATHNRHGTVVVERPPHLFHYALVLEAGPEWSRYRRALCGEAERLTAAGPARFSIYADIDARADGPGQERLMTDIAAKRLAGCILDMHPESLGDNPLLGAPVPKVALTHDSRRADIPSVGGGRDGWLDQALGWLRGRGRRRVAWLGIPNIMPPAVAEFRRAAARHGFETRPAWTHAVHPLYPTWAGNAMDAVFGTAAAVRPDALLITDDHLAEAATAGLARLKVRIPQNLDIVCLNNFPLTLTTHVAVRQLGYDARKTLGACLDVLARLRAGGKIPRKLALLAAEFAPMP
ncbi:MAG: hypothetical protein BWZ02_02592 [Lentisphaerae bacterium ADurb.BinA184]|nr:MAG: hypothetical protein BWZ02_02592 [Lentisphaerae bacterium ADurb.BinA184]